MAWVVNNGSPRMILRSPIVMGLVAGVPAVSLVARVSVVVLVVVGRHWPRGRQRIPAPPNSCLGNSCRPDKKHSGLGWF